MRFIHKIYVYLHHPRTQKSFPTPKICVHLCDLRAHLFSSLLLILFCGSASAFDKSGVKPNTISLPKGPGSIEGLGESFEPTLNNGTAKYAVPIRVSPGTAGQTPSISLTYEGGRGNGPLGFGWECSPPYIQRQTDKGIPLYVDGPNGLDDDYDGTIDEPDEVDVFIDDSKEELVSQADGHYFQENEGAFIRYKRVGDYWEANAPDGSLLIYGLTEAARITDSDTGHIFKWLLEKEIDTRGNTIVYTYSTFAGYRDRNQKYLSGISYGPGAPPWANFHFVSFRYEPRPDWFEDGRPGFLVRTGMRLKEVVVGTQGPTLANHLSGDFNADGTTDNLDRKYILSYLEYAAFTGRARPLGAPLSGTTSHWSFLAQVQPIGADGESALPPITFDYSVSEPPGEISAAGHIIGSINEPFTAMDSESVDLVDLNGDGLPDILKTFPYGGSHQCFLNEGEVSNGVGTAIKWSSAQGVASADGLTYNVDLQNTEKIAHLADMDGDGLADLAYRTADPNGSVYYFKNQGNVSWGPRKTMSSQDVTPPAPFGDANVKTADIDFDKRIDIIQSSAVGESACYQIWFNLGEQRYSRRVTVAQENGVLFSLSGVDIADFNGDRVPDITRIRSSTIEVTAGLGYGRFADKVILPIPDTTLTDQQIAKAKLQDITGDGLVDLVIERAGPLDTLWYWVNQGNYTLGPKKIVTGMPTGLGTSPSIRWADINGNGTVDLIYSDSQYSPRIRSVDLGELIGSGKDRNMLVSIRNGIGSHTRIFYESSTKYILADKAQGKPWPDPLSFPVNMVGSVIVDDSLGHYYTNTYAYHDGYYDPIEKEFRGFARVEAVTPGDATIPELVTRSYFDTGRTYECMKGKLLRAVAEREDGAVFWDDTTTWETPPRILHTGVNGQHSSYASPIGHMKTISECGQGQERKLESAFSYDNYGNQTFSAEYGIVEGTNRAAFDDERITTNEYAINQGKWILRAVARQKVMDENGKVYGRSENYYDDPTFSGGNFGQVTKGELTLARAWIDPANETAFTQTLRNSYDAYGNILRVLDPLAVAPGGNVDLNAGHCRELVYDSRFHAYPEQEIIHVGDGKEDLTISANYDFGLATIISSVDFNGHQTTYGYDTFGRLINILRPGDTPEYPSMECDYFPAQPYGASGMVNYVETRLKDCPQMTQINADKEQRLLRVKGDNLNSPSALSASSAGNSTKDFPQITQIDADKEQIQRGGNSKTPNSLSVSSALSASSAGNSSSYFISRSFVDGLGRTLMTRTEGDHAGQIVVSGTAQFNVRGKPWKQYLPYFEENGSFDYTEPTFQTGYTEHFYDALGREIRVNQPPGTNGVEFSTTTYEPLVTVTHDEEQTKTNSIYYGCGKKTTEDGLFDKDGNGRILDVCEIVKLSDTGEILPNPVEWHTTYTYDPMGNMLGFRDSKGNGQLNRYDGLNRRTYMNNPDRGEMFYTFDAASNLKETRDAKQQVIRYTYDGVNRPLTEDYIDEDKPFSAHHQYNPSQPLSSNNFPDVAFFYDTPVPLLDMGDNTRATARNTKGFLSYVVDLSGEEHASYDERGRIEYSVKRIPDPLVTDNCSLITAPWPLVSYLTRFTYDEMDRVARLTYPDNDYVTYEFNNRSLMERIVGGSSCTIISNIAYQASGQMEEISYGNSVRTTYAYDHRMRLTSLLTGNVANWSNPMIAFDYDFDGVSNIRAIHDRRPGTVVPVGDKRRNTQLFQYDSQYRLTQVQYSFNLPGDPLRNDGFINYRYDPIGNMVSQTSDIDHQENGFSVTDLGTMLSGGALGTSNRVGRAANDPPGPHALTEIRNPHSAIRNYVYDSNGNMTNIDGLVCTWDFKDRLFAAENDKMRAEYTYDCAGQRVTKKVESKDASNPSNQSYHVLYIGKHYEIREHDEPVKYVFNGETRVARINGSLSDNLQIQRLRISRGWNLVSVGITVNNAYEQFRAYSELDSVVKWNSDTRDYTYVTPGDILPAGSILWIRATNNTTLSILGRPAAQTNLVVEAGGTYIPGFSWGASTLSKSLITNAIIGKYNTTLDHWQLQPWPGQTADCDLPDLLSPGDVAFVSIDTSAEIETPDPALRIRYYHQDHLGSSSYLSDASGQVIEDSAYYPYGYPRNEYQLRNIGEYYKFTQKEFDLESRLHYFEARYQHPVTGRFITVDPLLDNRNSYVYCAGNPLRYTDPQGTIEMKTSIYDEGIANRPGTKLIELRSVVIHWTAEHDNTPKGVKDWWQKNGNTGAHYIIGKGGDIWNVIPNDEVAYHAGSYMTLEKAHANDSKYIYTEFAKNNYKPSKDSRCPKPNLFTVGIEMIPKNKDTGEYTDDTRKAAVELAAYLLYTLKIRNSETKPSVFDILFGDVLVRHSDISTKPCPKLSEIEWMKFKLDVAAKYISLHFAPITEKAGLGVTD